MNQSVVRNARTADTDAARQRLALAQTALLSALVAGTPVPEGFAPARVRVQSRALAAKRADVTRKVAPELPRILGESYRPSFISYAMANPLPAGARRDALAFVEGRLGDESLSPQRRRELAAWLRERTGPAPERADRLRRLARAARRRLATLRQR